MAFVFVDRNVPSPKNFRDEVKTENPTVIGLFRKYGSVNENWTDFCRFPAESCSASVSPATEQVICRIVQSEERPTDPRNTAVKRNLLPAPLR